MSRFEFLEQAKKPLQIEVDFEEFLVIKLPLVATRKNLSQFFFLRRSHILPVMSLLIWIHMCGYF